MYKIIRPVDAQNVLDLPGICGDMRYHSTRMELVELTIDAGKSIAPHKMEMKVLFYLLEGSLEFNIDGEIVELSCSELLEVEPHSERATYNSSANVARLLVIKEISD